MGPAHEFSAKVENGQRLVTEDPKTTPAELAVQADYADQSHITPALKRATGFSSVSLNARIANAAAFWCDRLLGERS